MVVLDGRRAHGDVYDERRGRQWISELECERPLLCPNDHCRRRLSEGSRGVAVWAIRSGWGATRSKVVIIGLRYRRGRGYDRRVRAAVPAGLSRPTGRPRSSPIRFPAVVRFFNTATRAELGRISFAADSLVPTAEVPGSPCPEGVTPHARWEDGVRDVAGGVNRVVAIGTWRRAQFWRRCPPGFWSGWCRVLRADPLTGIAMGPMRVDTNRVDRRVLLAAGGAFGNSGPIRGLLLLFPWTARAVSR